MTKRGNAIAATAVVVLAACTCGAGLIWAKKKSALPPVVLNAQTVFVMIDPDAAIPVNDPSGNRTAREDVEKALMEWGRLKPTMTMSQADLVIVVRKGDKQAMNPTVGGQSPNDRPVIVQATDDTIRIGGQQGRSPDAAQNGGPTSPRRGDGRRDWADGGFIFGVPRADRGCAEARAVVALCAERCLEVTQRAGCGGVQEGGR